MRRSLSLAVYSYEALMAATSAYRDICSVTVIRSGPAAIEIEIRALPGVSDEKRAAQEFLNYLLDASLEGRLADLQGRGLGNRDTISPS